MGTYWTGGNHVHNQFLGPHYVARQAAEAEEKLQKSHYDGERKTWDWDKNVTLHKEQHPTMESITDHDYCGMDNYTKICHFLQSIKRSEFEAVVNVFQAQPEPFGMNFDATVSYLGQIVTKKSLVMQSVHIAKIRSQPVRPKVVVFMGKWNGKSAQRQSGIP